MTTTLPPITDAHRQQALELMSWRGWTLAAALADPIRSRVLECRAAAIRTREWQAAVEQRATATGGWRAPTLWSTELEAISTLVDVHLYQVRQLSYGEFRAVYQQTIGQVRTQGGRVVMGVAGHG